MKFKSTRSFLTMTFCFFFLVNAQSQNIDTTGFSKIVLAQAQTMGEAFIKKDFKTLFKFTHPTIVDSLGGESKAIENLGGIIKGLEADGYAFLNVSFSPPSKIIFANGEWQCTLQQFLDLKARNGSLKANAFLIAISKDNGKNWVFIDTSNHDNEHLKQLFPNLSSDLVIPEKPKPVYSKG